MARKAQHAIRYARVPLTLRSLREGQQLTQRALGKILKRPQSWIYNCETGNRRVDVMEFIDWCVACGYKPTDVIISLQRKSS